MPNVEHSMTLQTIESESLQQVTINFCVVSMVPILEALRRESLELDRLFAQFLTSRSIRQEIIHVKREEGLIRGILH